MLQKGIVLVVILVLLVSTHHSWAARLPEKRESATHILSGLVQRVYVEKTMADSEFQGVIVEIRVDTMEMGTGFKRGDLVHVLFYEPNPSYRPTGVPRGPNGGGPHRYVPKKGEIVKVFLKGRHGNYSAVWPDGVDVLGHSDKR